ncbi:MAG: polysaccharide biosynthesis/export family protein [Gemmobacter sp.]
MTQFAGKVALITACLSILSACSDPPGGAPQAGQILSEASQKDANYAVYPVTRDTLPLLASWPRHDRAREYGWIKRQSGPSSQVIAPGDVIDLAIWDNGDSSLLMQKGQKTVEMKGIRVTPAGEVFLPYVDQVYIANMTPDRARGVVQEKFAAISPTAQVQLLHTPGRESSVDLISGVTTPGSFPLPDRDVTVLGLIAMGGGISKDLINPQVRLSRNGKLYGISANKLMDEPSLDTTLAGGDKVYLESDERYFLSLGAANKESQVFFPSDQVTVLDAASLVGGLSATRANAKGVLILREYPSTSVRTDETGPKTNRVVFVFDLKSADGLFSAGEFPIQHKDLVLVTESSVVGTATIISLIYEAFGIVIRAEDLT